MSMKIVGLEHSQGAFVPSGASEGVNYDNIFVYCLGSKGLKSGFEFVGQSCESYKIKTKDFYTAFPGLGMLADAVGLFVTPLYNQYGKVCSFQVDSVAKAK